MIDIKAIPNKDGTGTFNVGKLVIPVDQSIIIKVTGYSKKRAYTTKFGKTYFSEGCYVNWNGQDIWVSFPVGLNLQKDHGYKITKTPDGYNQRYIVEDISGQVINPNLVVSPVKPCIVLPTPTVISQSQQVQTMFQPTEIELEVLKSIRAVNAQGKAQSNQAWFRLCFETNGAVVDDNRLLELLNIL